MRHMVNLMVLDFCFLSYGVICLLSLPLLAIWTSPKSNVSMVNWLADCRFDLDYRIAWRVWITFNKSSVVPILVSV